MTTDDLQTIDEKIRATRDAIQVDPEPTEEELSEAVEDHLSIYPEEERERHRDRIRQRERVKIQKQKRMEGIEEALDTLAEAIATLSDDEGDLKQLRKHIRN